MKIGKIRIVLLALALLPLLSSCKLDEPESPIQELQSYEYRFSIVEETKALLNDNGVFWVDGDQVGLFAAAELQLWPMLMSLPPLSALSIPPVRR